MKKDKELYLMALSIVFVVKYHATDANSLKWILAPTAWWVRILSGISFEYINDTGYVSHACQFIIAPSCAGVRFLILTFIMLVFTFLRYIGSYKKRTIWFLQSLALSYGATVFVNGIRITVSILLPPVFERKNLLAGWLTPERLHTIIGISIYFSALFLICQFAFRICFCGFAAAADSTGSGPAQNKHSLLTPVFWYLLMVLAVPFLGRLYRNAWEGFPAYSLLVITVCGLMCILIRLLGRLHDSVSRAGKA